MDVTVIVPVFNKAAYLRACLESIAAQTLADIAVVCVDDGSTDGSLDILFEFARLDGRIQVLRQASNRGAAHARNTGLGSASASFVQFTDADDLLPVDALRTLHVLAVRDNVPVVRGSLANLDSSGIQDDEAQRMPDRHRFRLPDEPKLWVPYFHVCYLFEMSFLVRHHVRYPELANGEDPVFLARSLTRANALSTTSQVTYVYRRLPRVAPSVSNVMDFISHIRQVRNIYLESGHHRCWFDGASPFYRRDLASLRAVADLGPLESHAVDSAALTIWPPGRDEFSA